MTANESQFLTNMTTKRAFAAKVVVDDLLWITGGYNATSAYLSSTETIRTDGSVVPGPPLPLPLWGHATVNVNTKLMWPKILIIGGNTPGPSDDGANLNKTYYFNLLGKWSDGPKLNIGRSHLAAGIVTDKITNESIVVVSGGWGGTWASNLKSTELLLDNRWVSGKKTLQQNPDFSTVSKVKQVIQCIKIGNQQSPIYVVNLHFLRPPKRYISGAST